ncbi:MAG: dihydropteroate synthase [Actinomycetota bacterium]|nr:dihydropteroate synthase [Actinomycetota bacterium]MDI6822255.1 dihydropteroate synthase [Actinomycetota bacterium]
MLAIGEKINVISRKIGAAMKAKDPKPIQELAIAQVNAGANMLDVNIGPATKGGPELMEWLVKTIQEVVDIPLSLDTTNPKAVEAGLKVHKGQALINSASGQKERLESMLPLAKKYDAKIIGLTMTEKGIPRDANERASIAVDIITAMAEYEVHLENLYLDPLLLPIGVAQQQTMEAIEAVRLFKQLHDPPLKTVVGLSNISNGVPAQVKPILDRTLLAMLMTVGLDAAILDPLDEELMKTLKTAQVFRNEILYCHSYLD